jgi:hypothetical protein
MIRLMTRSKWLFYTLIAVAFLLGAAVPFFFGLVGALVVMVVCCISALFLLKKAVRLFKAIKAQEWRDGHPGMTDDLLPEHLK